MFLTLMMTIVLGAILPGAGHFYIGHRGRGLVFAITILTLFFGGMLIGGIQSIGPADQPIWRVTQCLALGPYMVGNYLAKEEADPEREKHDFWPKLRDVGSVYCGIAGMLNLLVLFDASVRIAGHRKPGVIRHGERDK